MAICQRLGALSGASSVAMAAYGAHAMKGADPTLLKVFDNGNKLHMAHSCALLACSQVRLPMLTASLFASGVAIFSGSCYAAALTGDRTNGKLAPLGGTALIVAWLTCAL